MNTLKHLKERTNLRTVVVSLVIFLVGISLLFTSEVNDYVATNVWLKAVVANLGGLLVATISIATLWELFSKRAFLDELLSKAGLAEDIRTLGLVGLSVNPLRGPDFSKLIRGANKLDIFVCYANTWRANYEEDLRVLARKPGVRIRLIVPNPYNMEIMKELAHRFGSASEQVLAEKIKAAIEESKNIFVNANNQKSDFTVWVHEENPVTSFYRFDNIAVVTLYKHARGRGNVPTFTAERGGTLYNYVEAEVDGMIKGIETHSALAKKIYPS
jgi:hypothetical protein